MTYEDQVAIGSALIAAIDRGLKQELGPDYSSTIANGPELVAAIAQEVLMSIDRANYQITRK